MPEITTEHLDLTIQFQKYLYKMSESQRTPDETPSNETRAATTLAILGCGTESRVTPLALEWNLKVNFY